MAESNYNTQFVRGNWQLYAVNHGRSLNYTPNGGAQVAITAVWQPGRSAEGYYDDTRQQEDLAVLKASPDDIASPDDRDTFEVDSQTWGVVEIVKTLPLVIYQLERRVTRTIGDAARIER